MKKIKKRAGDDVLGAIYRLRDWDIKRPNTIDVAKMLGLAVQGTESAMLNKLQELERRDREALSGQ